MLVTILKIPGSKEANPVSPYLAEFFSGADVISYRLEAARSGSGTDETAEINSNDVVITTFDNGIQWVHKGNEFVEKAKSRQSWGRGAGEGGVLTVPLYWQEPAAASRGLGTSLLKLLGIKIIKNTAGKLVATQIAGRIEKNNPNILYQCDADMKFSGSFNAGPAAIPAKYLLLLHGTGSNTEDAFYGIRKNNIFSKLFQKYEGRVISFEHKTFTQGPVKNAIDLVKQLPNGATLDIISHSRGGLVGEILARLAAAVDGKVFTDLEMELLGQNEDAAALLDEIKTLNGLAQNISLSIGKFIRVACPASGTTLVSERADNLLNTMCNLLSLVPGEVVGTLADALQTLIVATFNEKNSTKTLPGIECMRPDSAFIKALNFKSTIIASDLFIVAGDAEGDGLWGKLKMFLVDAFYREDNDLIVNTTSMKKGTARTNTPRTYETSAADVNHFKYFENEPSCRVIYDVLTGQSSAVRSGVPDEKAAVPDLFQLGSRTGDASQQKPVLILIPGIMGSTLAVNNELIWVNLLKMAGGTRS